MNLIANIKFIVFVGCILFTNICFSKTSKFTTYVNINLPKAITNNFYADAYRGVITSNLMVDYSFNKFLLGAYFDYKNFEPKNTFVPFLVGDRRIKTSSFFSYGLNAGYRYFNDDVMMADVKIGIGLSNIFHRSILNADVTDKLNYVPNALLSSGMYWYVEEYKLLLVGLNVNYQLHKTYFDAALLGFQAVTNNNRTYLSQFSIGFSISYKIGLPKD